ncbi:MAG: hypothetical protein KGL39_07880 [Patescibacteria group bacterium]|nr:hypothetical protein [Patescibacteria group bacterium]
MSAIRFLGKNRAVAQVATFSITADDATTTYKLTSGSGQVVSVPGTGTGTSATATALQEALAACTDPEFTEVTFTVSTATITITANTPGQPFSFTSSVSGGTGTISAVANSQANVSPSDVNDTVNYDTGALPVSTNDLYFDGGASVAALWNLGSLSGVTLNSLNFLSTFTYDCGLPAVNDNGYPEWRPDYLTISATTLNVGDTSNAGSGSGRIKVNTGSVQTAVNVYSTGGSEDPNAGAFLWKGTHAANTMQVQNGTVSVAIYGGETATLATLTVSGGAVVCGLGTTLTTVTVSGGNLDAASAITTLVLCGDGTHTHRAGNITTATVNDTSTLQVFGAITITTLNLNGGTLDLTNAGGTVTVINLNLNGGSILDPGGFLVTTNPAPMPNGLDSVSIERGGKVSIQFS